MGERKNKSSKYVTNMSLDNNLYYEKLENSTLPTRLLFATQDFCKKYIYFFIFLKYKYIPFDIINVISHFIYADRLCINYIKLNIEDHGKHYYGFNINHCNDCKTSIQCGECNTRILGSLYCEKHMNCKCGFNRRFEQCDVCSGNSSKYIQYNYDTFNKDIIMTKTPKDEYLKYQELKMPDEDIKDI